MKVIKFGGTSVQNAESIKIVKDIILNEFQKMIIVVSAVAGITNKLENIYKDLVNSKFKEAKLKTAEVKFIHLNLIKDLDTDCYDLIENLYFSLINIIDSIICLGDTSARIKDLILSYGEQFSSTIIHSYLKKFKPSIEWVDPREFIKTDSEYSNAGIDEFATSIAIKSNLLSLLDKSNLIITGGFIGSDSNNNTTTIGRGGSDYTASIIGKYTHADVIEIWTDVDGIMTADPSIVENAKIVEQLNYDEALNIALSGGKVIHYKTIFPAIDNKIPITIRNTFNTDCSGTIINSVSDNDNLIKSVVVETGFVFLQVKIRNYFTKEFLQSIVHDMIDKNEINILFNEISNAELKLVLKEHDNLNILQIELEKLGILTIHRNQALINIIGKGITCNKEVLESISESYKIHNFNINNIVISETNVRILIDEKKVKHTVQSVHRKLFS